MNGIKFSVIICTYNMEKSIERTINSILSQTFTNYEIIIYNDASEDNTIQIVKKANSDKITLINGKKNVGLGAGRNKAVKRAKGEYILYLDADDSFYEDTTLEKINEVVDRKKADVTYFGVQYIGGSNKAYIPNAENSTKAARILCDMQFAVSSKCFKRSFLEKKDITFIEGIYYEDMIYSIKCTILANKIDYGEFVIYNYTRNNDASIMSTPNVKKCSDMFRMLANVMDLYNITPEKYKSYLLSFIEQETSNAPYKIKEILRAYRKGTRIPVFKKRQYKFDEEAKEIFEEGENNK